MKKLLTLLSVAPLVMLASCQTNLSTQATAKEAKVDPHRVIRTIHGEASWYEIKCNGGTHTASGIPLQDHAMTAAHKTLPMGTKVRVTNKHNGKSVIVKITDRGPYIKGRVIDVTKGAAKKLGLLHHGLAPCKVEVLVNKEVAIKESPKQKKA